MPGLSSLYVKLIGGAVAALLLLGLILGLKHYKGLAESRGASLAAICQTTRSAANNPKMKCGEVPAQIGLMGQAIANLKTGIAHQNAAVNALGAESDRQRAEADKAVLSASTRAHEAEATSARLSASSRSGGPPCEPSKALKGAWR
jgi:hypothetical protein